MDGEELAWCTIARQGELLATRGCSPVELTEAYLSRIERLEPELNAYVTVTVDRALEDARRAEAEMAGGRRRSPLHGVPIGLKDLIDTAGLLTTAGSRAFASRVPAADATIALRLRQAGSVLLGKHATHELAYGGTTENEWRGPTHNPWDSTRVPGGSSGGSAVAVAAALAAGAVGTDTCGSIRIPAALSGCVGVKPTRELVSLAGVIPLAPGLDHGGPLARSVEDAGILLDVIAAAPVAGDAATSAKGIENMRIGVLRPYFCELLDDGVAAAFEEALAVLGQLGAVLAVADADMPSDAAEQVFVACGAEAHVFHDPILASHAELIGPEVRARMEIPAARPQALWTSHRALRRIDAGIRAAQANFDVLVAPTQPIVAPSIGAREVTIAGKIVELELALTRCTSPFNVAGTPVVSVPCGFASGLPVGLQIVARRDDEPSALEVAAAYERATPWHEMRPDPPSARCHP